MSTTMTRLFVSVAVVSALSGPAVAVQSEEKTWKVEVLLNGKHLLWAHTHVAPADRPASVDETCVSHDNLGRLLGDTQDVRRDGANLDAMTVGSARGAVLRVQRRGRISSRLHRMGKEYYFPLEDLARALGAKAVRENPARVNLVLPESAPKAILVLNDRR